MLQSSATTFYELTATCKAIKSFANVDEYRSHLARPSSEAEFDANELLDLAADTAQVFYN